MSNKQQGKHHHNQKQFASTTYAQIVPTNQPGFVPVVNQGQPTMIHSQQYFTPVLPMTVVAPQVNMPHPGPSHQPPQPTLYPQLVRMVVPVNSNQPPPQTIQNPNNVYYHNPVVVQNQQQLQSPPIFINPPPTMIPPANNHPINNPNPSLSTSPKVNSSSGVYNKPLPPIPPQPTKAPPPLPQKKQTSGGTYLGTVESDNQTYDASSSSFNSSIGKSTLSPTNTNNIGTNRSRSLSGNTMGANISSVPTLYPSLSLSASFSAEVSPRQLNNSTPLLQPIEKETRKSEMQTTLYASSPASLSNSKEFSSSKENLVEHSVDSSDAKSSTFQDPALAKFLETHGLSKYLHVFEKEEIDFATLSTLNDIQLQKLGLPFGPRHKILNNLHTVYADSMKHVYLENIQIGKKLGSGHFGEVYEGEWLGTKVALKRLKVHSLNGSENGSDDLRDFIAEADVLFKLRHPNLLSYFGIYIAENSDKYIVTELMSRGSLLDLVRREYESFSTVELLELAKDAARGLVCLHANKIIHRDLALRNVLVTTSPMEDNPSKMRYIAKVCDFGLARVIENGENYYVSNNVKMPFKWSAPECLRHRKFSFKSDCYSMAILLYELFHYGEEPFLDKSVSEAVSYVLQGGRPDRPPGCPKEVYKLMSECWRDNAEERPSSEEIYNELAAICLKYSHDDSKSDKSKKKQQVPSNSATVDQFENVDNKLASSAYSVQSLDSPDKGKYNREENIVNSSERPLNTVYVDAEEGIRTSQYKPDSELGNNSKEKDDNSE